VNHPSDNLREPPSPTMQMPPGMTVMGQALAVLALSLVLTLPASPLASATVHSRAPDYSDLVDANLASEDEATRIADLVAGDTQDVPQGPKIPMSMAAAKQEVKKQEPVVEEVVQADATNAKEAAAVAKQAAEVANKVATHSIHITKHAKNALHHALGALHDARVETNGLSKAQKESLKKAEGKLREATKTAEYGKLKKLEERDAVDVKKEHMQEEMDKKSAGQMKKEAELEQIRSEIKRLRGELKEKCGEGGCEDELKELDEMEGMLNKKNSQQDNDELKAEIERLREQIAKMEKQDEGSVNYDIPQVKKGPSHELPKSEDEDEEEKEELMRDVEMKPLGKKVDVEMEAPPPPAEVTPVQEKGIDIDTQMPYGDLEPFGREDTAQELTENSVRESDEMVDQLERAEVAEEKRAVFRALTRLRGAAITSFDGVARSQTGNIDEYNKIHKWRKTHPLHHLADEESDVSKWAFPDNAD